MTSHSAREARLERQTKLAVDRFLANPIIIEGLRLVDTSLPRHLRYHTAQHTHEVLEDAVLLGVDGGLREPDLELLAVAAVYHDLGYVSEWARRGETNEMVGARLAQAALEAAGYPERAKRSVHTMILDTQLVTRTDGAIVPHAPSIPLSKYLLDADVANLGKDIFFEKAALLYAEYHGLDVTTVQDLRSEKGLAFLEKTLGFLTNHRWHSPGARRRWTESKRENIALLTGIIRSFKSDQAAAPERLRA